MPFKTFIDGMTRLKKDIDKTNLTYKQKMVLYNTLLRNGITDNDQLHEMNEIDLLSVHGIGIMYLTRLEEAGLIKRQSIKGGYNGQTYRVTKTNQYIE